MTKMSNQKIRKEIKYFLKYLVIWISQNLSIPFWMVGHVHLMSNVYEDITEILASVGMNLIVATGFIIDYLEQRKDGKQSIQSNQKDNEDQAVR